MPMLRQSSGGGANPSPGPVIPPTHTRGGWAAYSWAAAGGLWPMPYLPVAALLKALTTGAVPGHVKAR